ncbi:hypothetical protein BDV96DRAFT_485147 [Lophiotrema nucula]|uniref:G-patch domain-containing protein n=1 Tax=Lophiotrema nucula TaxID=690887 RepID=A0A6A5ZMN8_9PLEO|nr:hypothetical protein BDV96DRAFT_485147 [Lophiotrema nucula]
MAYKRPRATSPSTAQKRSRGAEGGAQNVKWGTPLPVDEDNDDGSFVPVWKQTVTDDKGRRRLHGAFTGGFSAGYFNTVGSKEGWTPKTFVSSRSNRIKDPAKTATQRPEDFMDNEDLAEAAESRQLETAQSFAAVGSNGKTERDDLFGLMLTDEDTMAVKLLQKMGWRRGQGIGPKIRRQAHLEEGLGIVDSKETSSSEHSFAPKDTRIVSFIHEDKPSRKGVGYQSGAQALPKPGEDDTEDTAPLALPFLDRSHKPQALKKPAQKKTGFGVGILNDNGSDDEDPYEIGPKISFNKVIGEKKTKKGSKFAKPNTADRVVFIKKGSSKPTAITRISHDGRPPLRRFVLASTTSTLPSRERFPPPSIPPGWTSLKSSAANLQGRQFQSVADAAKSSTLDAKARASLLGEAALPGKSIFDYMSKESRDRIAAFTGKQNLPPARGEVFPSNNQGSTAAQQKSLWSFVPNLDKDVAAAALAKGATGWMPYGEDPKKRERYVGFLELRAGTKTNLPERAPDETVSDWAKELEEFAHAAQVFKPVQGLMASRFTSSTSSGQSSGNATGDSLLRTPAAKPEDPAEQAAKLGMYGPMTRSVIPFYPTRLLCKRFNVKAPVDAPADDYGSKTQEAVSKADMDRLVHDALTRGSTLQRPSWMNQQEGAHAETPAPTTETVAAPVDVETNDALTQERPPEDVFRAIFGDDDDD